MTTRNRNIAAGQTAMDGALSSAQEEASRLLPAIPDKLHDGRDELNFAEFPLGAVAERISPGKKTLEFSDKIFDKQNGVMVQRKLTITSSDAYGLPTAIDDEVLLGLVQLAKLQRFESRTVYFSRYQLARLLGWPLNGQTYARLEQALKRWLGVSLFYEHAWRDKSANAWVDEGFHVLDNVKIDLAETEKSKPKPNANQRSFEFAASSFTWNKIVFASFQSGNLKTLDFSFVMGLRSAITKRLYRFLDKRFFHAPRVEIDLKTLAFEHVGLSRNLPTGDLKRKLRMATNELVDHKFLKPATDDIRFRKLHKGAWQVLFEKNSIPRRSAAELLVSASSRPETPASPIEERLVQRGIRLDTARSLAAEHPPEFILEKIEVFDFLVEKNDPKVSRNPSGFLIGSIQRNYSTPRNFEPSASREQKAQARADRSAKETAKAERRAEREAAKEASRRQAIDAFWSSLSPAGRSKAEEEALANAEDLLIQTMKRGGPLANAAKQSIFDDYALSKLAVG